MRQFILTSIPYLIAAAGKLSTDDPLNKALINLAADLNQLNSLAGISRTSDGGFVIEDINNTQGANPPFLAIDKNGVLTLGQNYGTKPNVIGNTLGSFYAVPQWARYYQAGAVAAGNGSYVWDTEAFNNGGDLYTRTTGNTRIQILVPGDYWVYAAVLVDTVGLVAGNVVNVNLLLNAGTIKTFGYQVSAAAMPDLATFVVAGMIQTTVYTDYIEVTLNSTGGAADRIQGIALTTLDICKVN